MSSFEAGAQALPNRSGLMRATVAVSLALALGVISGCQVRPLYADSGTTAGVPSGIRGELSQIAIKPVNSRYAQEVRNHLVFLFGGGKGDSSAGKYSMLLTVTASHESAALVQNSETDDNEPTAGIVTVAANYVVTDSATGQAIASGRRQMVSSYDLPRQEFAAMRARRDAENRAAREVAQMVQLSVAQDFSRR